MPRLSTSSFRIALFLVGPLLAALLIDQVLAPAEQVAPVEDPALAQYETLRPDILLVGNSITRTAFDAALIEQRLQEAGIRRHGVQIRPARQRPGPSVYLLIKYLLQESSHAPETIVLAARPSILYDNGYGTSPKYRDRYFRRYAGPDEPVLDEKLASAATPWSLHALLTRGFGLYRSRAMIQQRTSGAVFAASLRMAAHLGPHVEGEGNNHARDRTAGGIWYATWPGGRIASFV